jgi:hypothetical protein
MFVVFHADTIRVIRNGVWVLKAVYTIIEKYGAVPGGMALAPSTRSFVKIRISVIGKKP